MHLIALRGDFERWKVFRAETLRMKANEPHYRPELWEKLRTKALQLCPDESLIWAKPDFEAWRKIVEASKALDKGDDAA